MTPDMWTGLRPNEILTLREHLIRISDRDRNKRKRAMREYRTWLDYLVRIGRITEAQATKLECFRLSERYTNH